MNVHRGHASAENARIGLTATSALVRRDTRDYSAKQKSTNAIQILVCMANARTKTTPGVASATKATQAKRARMKLTSVNLRHV